MALAKPKYGLKKMKGGKGYSVRPWITNPYTGKKEQIFKQSKKWTKEDALNYVKYMEANPKHCFNPPENQGSSGSTPFIVKKLTMQSTVSELFEDYYRFAKLELKPSTIEGYKISYNTHIKTQLGHIKLSELNANLITDWQMYLYNYKKTKNATDAESDEKKLLLRNSSIDNIMAVIRNMISHGNIRRELNIVMPILEAKIKRAEDKYKAIIWSKEDRIKFFNIIAEKGNTRDMALFAFLMVTGARRGEALALQPNQIDFRKKEVIINKSLQKNGEVSSTKTNVSRTCKLDDYTLKLLENRVEELKKKEDYNPSKTFVFGGALPLSPTQCARIFNQYKDELAKRYPNISANVKLHGLRHSVATTSGETHGIEQARLYLNHSSIKTTQEYFKITYDEKVINTVALVEDNIQINENQVTF